MDEKFAIILSHIPHHISGSDDKIIKLRNAAEYIVEQNGIVVTSMGSTNWDLQLTLAVELSIPVILVVTKQVSQSSFESYVSEQFGNVLILEIVFVESIQERDSTVLDYADTVIPVWCRSGGRMSSLIRGLDTKKILCAFYSQNKKQLCKLKYRVGNPSKSLESLPDNYLWHWTRNCDGPWPDETVGEYCSSLLHSSSYPRSSLHTLQKIVVTKTIIGSGSCVSKSIPVVSFTENSPIEMHNHFSWRVGRHRMNFEPYGIGIPRALLEGIGAVPVLYNSSPSWNAISIGDRWKSEREWRVRGTVQITDEMEQKIIVIVRSKEEISFFRGFNCFEYESD